MTINFVEVFTAFMVLFAVIDITGSIPIIIDLKAKTGKVDAGRATLVAFGIMFLFLFTGEPLLKLFGVDISSFAIAGALVIFFLSLEMVLGIELFKHEAKGGGATIVPIAFPIIAGAGSITTILSLKAEFSTLTIIIALLLNMAIVYVVLKSTKLAEKLLGPAGIHILKKIFGIILLAIAVKLFLNNTGIQLHHVK